MINKGDIVKIVRTYDADEACYIGLTGEVVGVFDFPSDGSAVYDVAIDGETMEFYSEEVELVQPPKDYADDDEYAAKDADVSTWVKEEEIDEYNEIVIGLSQAIAMKAAQMRGGDSPRLMGEHVGFGCEIPTVDMPEDDDSDAAIYKELRGHGSSEANGILQAGISTEQALAARDRALTKKRKEDVEKAHKALEDAQKRYAEVSGDTMYDHPSFYVDGDIPQSSMTVQLNGKDIVYGTLPGHPHGINVPGKRSPDYNAGDAEWEAMEPVGAEIIYDAYNPDPVKAPEHYVGSGIEPIVYMADKLPAYNDGHTAFCVGNVIKYVSRAPHKGNMLQDLKKARQYLDFAIEHEEKKQN
jgi:hypothetical protein